MLLICLSTSIVRGQPVSPSPYADNRPIAHARIAATDIGPVLKHGAPYDFLGARDVFVWTVGGRYFMHYDAAGPQGWLVALATSEDGRKWTRHGTVLNFGGADADDSATASYGVTFHDRDVWHMFYVGSRHATPPPERIPAVPYLTLKAQSKGPAGPWIKQPRVVPFRPRPGTYYSDTACPGPIIRHGNAYLMFFSAAAYDHGALKRTLGIARTRDLNGVWTVQDKPILPLQEQIENTSLYFEPANQTWFLFTNHVGLFKDGGEYTDAIWVYWSRDVENWDESHKAIVLDSNNCTWSKRVVGLPSVVPFKDQLLIYYDGAAGQSTSHVNRDIALATLPLPLKPPG
jgi:predicted GH43/DUF377 family glycosyl hydrolase